MGEVRVVGIRVEQPQNQPVLLLREANGDEVQIGKFRLVFLTGPKTEKTPSGAG